MSVKQLRVCIWFGLGIDFDVDLETRANVGLDLNAVLMQPI